MRKGFEKDLRQISEVAKEDIEAPLAQEVNPLSEVIDWHLKKAAERQHTSVKVQREIYDLQKDKQKIMKELKEKLACIDDPACKAEKQEWERSAVYDEAAKAFVYEDEKNEKHAATFGEIVTDVDWGLYYHIELNPGTRLMVKKYLVERAKKAILELLDSQIIKSEVRGDSAGERRKHAYRMVERDRERGKHEMQSGFVAERMVKNFLKKLSIDHDAPFEILEADVYQDVAQKIDFVIHRKSRSRGVSVEADDKVEEMGVQFSINPTTYYHKLEQVERSRGELKEEGGRVKDIALVVFPLYDIVDMRKKWEEDGKKAGGPDKFFKREVAEKLFKELSGGVLTPEESEACWDSVKNNFANPEAEE